MANFNYTDLHFFDKHGIELPIAFQSNYLVEIQNEYGDNAVFYGLKDCSTNDITFVKKKSGNRFPVKNGEYPCILNIAGTSYSTKVKTRTSEVHSNSNVQEYSIDHIELNGIYTDPSVDAIIESLPFPTITMTSSLCFPRISIDLVETQSIYVLVENDNSIFLKLQEWNTAETINWKNHYKLLFYINNRQQEEFRFFTVDNSELKWTDKILFDFNNPASFKANIGFCAKEEGVYEETMYICLLEDYNPANPNSGNIYPIGAINLQAEAVGEDERYRTLFQNFGIPDPITYQEVFANTSLEEGKMDYMKLNENSKKLFLSYSEIFSYLGTYKALINAVNVLGYNDIFFKEWYKEIGKSISTQGYITYDMKYHSDDNANIINNIPIEERISLKKLNWISMVYRINKELKNFPEDKWGFPQSEEVYDYNNEEIITKLYSLKKWLEKYIIGLNCKIVDVSGEGIYFERYKLDTYGTFQQIYDWNNSKNLIPYVPTITLEDGDILDYCLIDSSVDIHVNVGLDKSATIEDYKNYKLEELTDGYIDSNGIYHHIIPSEEEDASVYIGRIFDCLNEFERYELKATSYGEEFLFGPEYLTEDSAGIRIANNRIFFNPYELLTKTKHSTFTLLPFIQIEKANIRKIDGNWNNSVKYRINPVLTDDSKESYSIKDLETGQVFTTIDYIMLVPPSYVDKDTYTKITSFSGTTIEKDKEYVPVYESDLESGSIYSKTINVATYGLSYSSNNVMDIPMFSIIGYEVEGNPDIINVKNEYFLEILDGKMLFNDENHNRKIILNFNYDEETGEQEVKINMIYTSEEFGIVSYQDRKAISNFIPGSLYSEFVLNYNRDPESAIFYDTTHLINVQNTGKFTIDVYAKDIHNNIFAKNCENDVYVHLPNFSMTTYTNIQKSNNEFDVLGEPADTTKLSDNYCDFCIYNNEYMIEGFSKSIDDEEKKLTINYPNYSYSFHRAIGGDYLHFMNISDKYFVDALDYMHTSTNDETYKGYGLVLERLGMNNITRVIEEYDSPALLSINNEYVTDIYKTSYEYMNDLYKSSSSLDFMDVNLVVYNELGNYPVLQTYASMINENAIPYVNGVENTKYVNNKYRLLIGEYSEESYIWASLMEHTKQNLGNRILQYINTVVPININYIDDNPSTDTDVTETNDENTFKYLDLKSKGNTFLPAVQQFISELIDSSIELSADEISQEELKDELSSLEESLRNIIESYDASVLDNFDTSTAMRNYLFDIVPNLKYTLNENPINLFISVRSLLCNDNTDSLDKFMEKYINDCLENNCTIENMMSTNDLYSSDSSGNIGTLVYDAYSDESTPVGQTLKNVVIDNDITDPIVKSVSDAFKNYGNDLTTIYQAFVPILYSRYDLIIMQTSQVQDYGVLGFLEKSTADTIKDDVLNVMWSTIQEINSEEYAETINNDDVFDSLYTKFLFAVCCYIGFSLIKYIIENNTDYEDFPLNTIYASYLGKTRDDVLIDSYEYTIQLAEGLYSMIFDYSEESEESEEQSTVITLNTALTNKYDAGNESSYQIYDRLIRELVILIEQQICSYWVTKRIKEDKYRQGSDTPYVYKGDVLYAVASIIKGAEEEEPEESEEETEESEETNYIYDVDTTNNYENVNDIPEGTVYYVKPKENPYEGLTFVQYPNLTNEITTKLSPLNVIPDLEELIKKPYISVYVQPTWKAQINISLIAKDDAERLGFENIEDLDYLCIQYVNSDFMWHFRKGEMIKLIFESLTNNEYVGQSSYEVVGYDTENQVVIVRGTINNAYIRGEKREVWAEILDDGAGAAGKPTVGTSMLKELNEKYGSIQGDIQERECQPFTKEYHYISDGKEYVTSYRLPVKRLNGVWYYKVFYFVNGIPRPIETQKIDPQEKVNMYISYAHNAFVDYIMKATDSSENSNGTTNLEIEYNNLNCRKMEFVDDTFVMSAKSFDTNEGLSAWMNTYKDSNDNRIPAILKKTVYSYTSENGFVPVNISEKEPNIVFEINFDELDIEEDESYVQWKIYKMIPTDNSRKFMFESYNKILYLDYAQPGIYDIEAIVYDKYGNTSAKLFKGAYKVTS